MELESQKGLFKQVFELLIIIIGVVLVSEGMRGSDQEFIKGYKDQRYVVQFVDVRYRVG